MRVAFKPSALKKTRWHEYVIRFVFGGGISVAASVLGHHSGILLGGIFLAFPALLPASLTLVKEHDGRNKAADDAIGAACGTIGLFLFALVVWTTASRLPIGLVLAAASVAWFVLSTLAWRLCVGVLRR